MNYIYNYRSPIGDLILSSDDGLYLNAFNFKVNKTQESKSEINNGIYKNIDIFQETATWLDIYFQGHAPDFLPPIKPEGTPFRMEVWELLQRIPFGQTTTYGAIAKEIALRRGIKKMSAQAVGGAIAHNPISIIIPCHRVIGKDGSLVGYSAGLDKKIYLLENESTYSTKRQNEKKRSNSRNIN